MHLTRDMVEAFGDWLELGRIQRALVDARPELAEALVLDAERPLLQIRCPGGGALLVARAADDSAGRWIVGVPARPEPVLHDADSPEEAVRAALEVLTPSSSPEQSGSVTDDPHRR